MCTSDRRCVAHIVRTLAASGVTVRVVDDPVLGRSVRGEDRTDFQDVTIALDLVLAQEADDRWRFVWTATVPKATLRHVSDLVVITKMLDDTLGTAAIVDSATRGESWTTDEVQESLREIMDLYDRHRDFLGMLGHRGRPAGDA